MEIYHGKVTFEVKKVVFEISKTQRCTLCVTKHSILGKQNHKHKTLGMQIHVLNVRRHIGEQNCFLYDAASIQDGWMVMVNLRLY